MMRKNLAMVLAMVLCLSLFGCSANTAPAETTPTAAEATTAAAETTVAAPKEDVVILYTNDVPTSTTP